jgi:hypothetical protein
VKPVAIFLYELSGKSAEPFAAAGWDCYCIDIAHERDRTEGNIHFVKVDARHWKPTKDMVLRCRFFAAFPPCDHLAISGARWFRGKGLHALAGSVELFAVAAEWAEFLEVPYFIENPVSTIATYWRKPDHTFHPWHFTRWAANDNYTKKTCLWTGGGFVMPPAAPGAEPVRANVIRDMAGKGRERGNARSVTPIGFMRAVYAANFDEVAA